MTKPIISFFLCILLMSCSSDYLFDKDLVKDNDSTVDCFTCIDELLRNNESSFNRSNLKITRKKLFKNSIDYSCFSEGEYSNFPVYLKDNTVLVVRSYESISPRREYELLPYYMHSSYYNY